MIKVGDTVTHKGLSAKQEKYGYPPLMGIVREMKELSSDQLERVAQVFWFNDSGAHRVSMKTWFDVRKLNKIQ